MTITKIEVQKNNNNKVNLYVDGVFNCGLSLECVVKNRLKEGMIVTRENLEYLKDVTEKELALQKCLKLLSHNTKTCKEIKNYLEDKGFEKGVEEYVLQKLKEYKYIDDLTFAKNYVKFKGRAEGKTKIIFELKKRGVAENIINKSLENYEEEEGILVVLQKYIKNKEKTPQNRQKAFKFLLSRGYSIDNTKKAINNFFREEENEYWD